MKIIYAIILVLLLTASCQETSTVSPIDETIVIFGPDSSDSSDTSDSSNTADSSATSDSSIIYIVDQLGRRWHITHAVKKYGFDPKGFEHGIGANAIKPILDPEFLHPGDSDYPGVRNREPIIGTVINGSVRAYPLSFLIVHEIVDEKFDSTYVAVAY